MWRIERKNKLGRGEKEKLFFVHGADSRNIWHFAIIYSWDLMIPWEVSLWCNESNKTFVSVFVCQSSRKYNVEVKYLEKQQVLSAWRWEDVTEAAAYLFMVYMCVSVWHILKYRGPNRLQMCPSPPTKPTKTLILIIYEPTYMHACSLA